MVGETWVISFVLFFAGGGSKSNISNMSLLRMVRMVKMLRISRMARLLRGHQGGLQIRRDLLRALDVHHLRVLPGLPHDQRLARRRRQHQVFRLYAQCDEHSVAGGCPAVACRLRQGGRPRILGFLAYHGFVRRPLIHAADEHARRCVGRGGQRHRLDRAGGDHGDVPRDGPEGLYGEPQHRRGVPPHQGRDRDHHLRLGCGAHRRSGGI
mmetsp:Transcript_37249/g.119212  ORF Transcript_37249/g.119212 Transcript_37249/m.119212 type:complete len:210 (+) Transcript_37249:184-813(+)